MSNEIIVKDPNVLGGEPVFRGTDVPFKALTDYLEGGKTLAEFIDAHRSVSRDAAIAALEQVKALVLGEFKEF